jgi:hypothetical protein
MTAFTPCLRIVGPVPAVATRPTAEFRILQILQLLAIYFLASIAPGSIQLIKNLI